MNKVLTKKSDIQGKGVFANQNFKKGEVVLDIDDTYEIEDQSKLSKAEQEWCDYLGDKTVVMQEPERYINHSCDPNSYVKTIKGIRKVIAMRDIDKGEEITYDYVINGYYDSAIKCHCGSKNCRKILNCNFFKLPKSIQRKYKPYLDTWFKRKFKKEISSIL